MRTTSKTLMLATLFLALGAHIILSVPFAVASNSGWSIDLFCQHGGVGKNVAAYPPFVVGERIDLFALVTYNQAPVRSVLVAFQVSSPQGSPVLVTTGQTNASGIATTNFTITESTYPLFPSSWESIATASPAQTTINDTMPFTMIEELTVIIGPTYALIVIGNSVLFISIVNGGLAPYYYQWYLNGTAVSSATNPTWTFKPTSVGTYNVYLSVTDSIGDKAKSNIAQVTVIAIPHIVGGLSTSANALNFLAPWLSTISLLAAAVMLKGIIVRKRRN